MKIRKDKKNTFYKIILFISIVFAAGSLCANPEGGVVAAGNATIEQNPGNTQVNQSSQNAIINWQSFNIGANESTHFQQPSVNSITLNRINPHQGVSQIFGRLTANGKIILVNQSGIFFAPGSYVNVGGIIVSAVDITDQNFLAGKYIFNQAGNYHGTVVNRGYIQAAHNGLIALVGSNVRNDGYIEANLGNVVLSSGDKFTMDLTGDGLVHFSVDAPSSASGFDPEGKLMRDGVKNAGTIVADGGKVLLSAKTAQGVVDNAVNMSGVVQARSVAQQNGKIILNANDGTAHVSGRMIVSGQTGGKIKVLGKHITVASTAELDASGDNRGGTILIGGNAHGAGHEIHAQDTTVERGAKIKADAIHEGDGGKIVVWSDNNTQFHGEISARGGANGGNGGFAETSGGYLDVTDIKINLSAAHGKTGTWLLDPTDLTISNAATSNVNQSGDVYTGDANQNTSNLNITTLLAALAAASVEVETTTGGTGLGNGDITLVDALTWTSTNTLTLRAANNIYLNADITAVNGGLILNAANQAQSITSGSSGAPSATGVTANINVANFNLQQGQWYQVNSSLPTFNVTHNFQLNSGTLPAATVQFTRAAGGNGSSGDPYQLVDIFGVQGIGSNSTTLGYSYTLNNNIDATVTQNWNSGAGFIPISVFTGELNGQNKIITNLFVNSAGNYAGLFGQTSGATISNIQLQNVAISGVQYVGGLIGQATSGTVTNASVTSGTVQGDAYVGGLVGSIINTAIANSSAADAISGKNYLGGLVGENVGTLINSIASGTINIETGGFVAVADTAAFGTGQVTVNSGATLQVNNVTLTNDLILSGFGLSGTNGVLVGTGGNAVVSGRVMLAANVAFGTINSGDVLKLSGSINANNFTVVDIGPGKVICTNSSVCIGADTSNEIVSVITGQSPPAITTPYQPVPHNTQLANDNVSEYQQKTDADQLASQKFVCRHSQNSATCNSLDIEINDVNSG